MGSFSYLYSKKKILPQKELDYMWPLISGLGRFNVHYGFDIDRMRFIKVQCLIRFLFYFNWNKNQISILCMLYLPFTSIWVRIVSFSLSSLKVRVFFSKDNGGFTPLTPLRIDFSWIFLITLSLMSATCRWDCSHHWTFTPQPLIFAIWRLARCLPRGGVIPFDVTGGRRY